MHRSGSPVTAGSEGVSDEGTTAVADRHSERTIFGILVAAGLLGVLAGLPFIFAILGDADSMRIWRAAGAEFLLQILPAVAVGVWLGPKVGLGPRLLRDLLVRSPGRLRSTLRMLLPSVVIGGLLGLPLLLGAGPEHAGPGPGALFLRALSAALTEEIEFRLGLMTLFAWVLCSFVRRSGSVERSVDIANVLAALVFAAGHLPGNVTAETATLGLVVGILVFNSVAGIAMGWLYARYGLLAAMLAHLVADLEQAAQGAM